MKSILVYGDSNTWGQTSQDLRYDYNIRWTSRLQKSLGDEYDIIVAGLSGRIAGSYQNVHPIKRGKDAFEVVYRQSFPIDLLIVALGSNDIKKHYEISAEDIIKDLLWYSETIKNLKDYQDKELSPRVLYLMPTNFDTVKFPGDERKKQQIIKTLTDLNRDIMIINDIDISEDGVHFSEKGHQQMAKAVEETIKEMNI